MNIASGRLAGRIQPKRQIRYGFIVMVAVSLVNVTANLLFTPHVSWALIPGEKRLPFLTARRASPVPEPTAAGVPL